MDWVWSRRDCEHEKRNESVRNKKEKLNGEETAEGSKINFYSSMRRARPKLRHKAKTKQEKDVNLQKRLKLPENANKLQKEQVYQSMRRNEMISLSSFPGAAESPEAAERYALLQQKVLAGALAWKAVHEENSGYQPDSAEHDGLEALSDVLEEFVDLTWVELVQESASDMEQYDGKTKNCLLLPVVIPQVLYQKKTRLSVHLHVLQVPVHSANKYNTTFQSLDSSGV